MCINCNLLTPLVDWVADIIGVERRKYLVLGHTLSKYTDRDIPELFSNDIINYKTAGAFQIIGDTSSPSLVTEDGIKLYECKYKQIKPVERDHVRDANAYRELFMGDIEFITA